jgi:hypothetical protein
MPKYIKLFEAFQNEAQAYKFDPTKSVLTGAAVYSAGTSYAKFTLGRIYIATEDNESTKKAPGNVLVYLTAKNKDVEKKLTDLGGVAAALQASEINEPPAAGGGVYKYQASYIFNLTDPVAGDQILGKIAAAINTAPTGSTGTSGIAGTAGSKGDYAEGFFGKDIMAAFRSHVADVTGVAYQAATSIPAYQASLQNKELNKRLNSDSEFLKLMKEVEEQAKLTNVVDFTTGKTKDGKIDAKYLEIRKKVAARTEVIKGQLMNVGTSGTAGTAGKI